MSIYVAISRRNDPLDDDGDSISFDDWLAIVDAADDFERDGDAFIWTAHPAGVRFQFEWSEGQIEVKNPDPPTIARMQNLAKELDAAVFSETGEVFDDDGVSAGFLDGFP